MILKTTKSFSANSNVESSNLFTLGVDSGSLTAKAVIMDEHRQIVSHSVVQLGFVSEKAVNLAIENTMASAGLKLCNMAYIVSTGYGRRRLSFESKPVTEISCHAKGANYLFPDIKTVIDIGGQDSKVISVDKSGNTINFAMNDKCAAGTGQFLEVMSRAMGIEFKEMGELSLQSQTELTISSMCTVFAESEVISLVAQRHKEEDIIAAIYRSIAGRIVGLVGRVGLRQPVIMTGGVAQNIGVVRAIEKELNVSILVPSEPQIVGAIGAALFALDYAERQDPRE